MCKMKNITLSIPEELLQKSREYAQKHGTSLNEMIRTLLIQTVTSAGMGPVQRLKDNTAWFEADTKGWKWNREELYDRKIFS